MNHVTAFSLSCLFWATFALGHGLAYSADPIDPVLPTKETLVQAASSQHMQNPERYLDSGSGGRVARQQHCQEWAADAAHIAQAKVLLGWAKEKLRGDLKPASEIGEEVHQRMVDWIEEAYQLETQEQLQAWVYGKFDECMSERT